MKCKFYEIIEHSDSLISIQVGVQKMMHILLLIVVSLAKSNITSAESNSVDVVKNGIGNEYYYRIQLVNKPRCLKLVLLLIVYYHY